MSDAAVAQLPAQVSAAVPTRPREIRVVNDPVPVLDTARFEHMQRVANVMAGCSLIPDALCKTKTGQDAVEWLPERQILSNCFMVVNQAVRWAMDPFAVAQCVSVVHGKLCYEGKLIAAVINAKLGFDLEYEIAGEGDNMKVVVTAALDGKPVLDSKGKPKKIEGTVGEWKTTGRGSPWEAPGGKPRMLRYRGAREWCRVHAPALMLGVYSDDEMEILSSNDRRGLNARDVSSYDDEPPAPPPPPQIAKQAAVDPQPEPEREPEQQTIVDAPSTAPDATEAEVDDGPPPPAEASTSSPAQQQAVQLAAKPQPIDDLSDIPAALRRPTAKPSGAVPDAAKQPKEFLAWIDSTLSAVIDGEKLADVWSEKVEPHMTGLFPPDAEAAAGLYRKHERRLEP
jgi:hypothetical protein